MEIAIGYTLAPRAETYINRSIASLRAAGFCEKIYIYAEPWEYTIKDDNFEMIVNKNNLWCFKNYDNALSSLIKKNKKYVWVLQDDFVIMPETKTKVAEFILDSSEFGYLSINTPFRFPDIHCMWWNISALWWGARPANYIMRTDTAIEVQNHPFYINHLENYEDNKQVDACISECMKQLWKTMYYHNPSLSVHIGKESSIEHIDEYNGMRYWKLF